MYRHLALGPDAETLSVGGSLCRDGTPETSGHASLVKNEDAHLGLKK